MANVRLLRQSIEDYQKDASAANEAYEAAYGQYSKDFEAQQAQHQGLINAYNAELNYIAAGNIGYIDHGNGNITMVKGVDENGKPIPVEGFENQRGTIGAGAHVLPAVPVTPTPITAPAIPEEIKAPNLTVSNTRELMNPGQNQAQLGMQSAKGILGKSELAGDQQAAMRGSAFADPNDPQGLKERGVLARVMGGQL